MSIIGDIKGVDLKNIDLKNIDLKSPQVRNALLIVIGALAAAALYIYFIFVPQVIKVFTFNASIGKVKSELGSARGIIKDFDKLKSDLAERGQKVESYEKNLPAEQEIPALLETLSSMAGDSGIKIVSIVPAMSYFNGDKLGNKSPIYREIPILITAKSGYHELGRFLKNLENSDRFMKVVDINIRANKTSPKKHDVELMVCTYILLQEHR